jgi:hypothetical protein
MLYKFPLQIAKATLAGGAGSTVIYSKKVPLGNLIRIEAEIRAEDETDTALYKLSAVVRNKSGTVDLVGSAVVDAFETDSSWNATISANDTDDTFEISLTPDGSNATTYVGELVYYQHIEDL